MSSKVQTIPEDVATFIVEQGVQTASQAAVLADEWELTHQSVLGESELTEVVSAHALLSRLSLMAKRGM